MSLSKNQELEAWKAVEDSLRSRSFTCFGHSVVGADAHTLGQVFTLWCLIIRDLCGVSRLRSRKKLASWVNQLACYPLNEIVDALKFLASTFRDYNHDMGVEEGLESFKRILGGVGKIHYRILEPFQDVVEKFLRDCNPTTLQVLLTCIEFPSRTTLNDLPEVLEVEQKKYLDLEEAQNQWQYPDDILVELREIVQDGLMTFPALTYRTGHGNGAVADVKEHYPEAKWRSLFENGLTPRLHHYFCQMGLSHPLVAMQKTHLGTASRVLFVPKGMTSKRVISSEPTCNMWFQQAILQDLADWLPWSPFKVTMKDQTKNRLLAQEGSISRNYGTIDLSSASDSVTYTLVRYLFEGTPLWDALWSCRSSYALLDGHRIKLNKFAPMGSAVCFPIMCIVFSAIVHLARKRVGIHSNYAVYGDDIVCHASCYDEVISLLQQLHFSVNEKKTFPPCSPFKESCGGEYYYGTDVTPLRIPRFFQGWTKPDDVKANPRLFSSWCSLANTLYASGPYYESRAYFVRRFLDVCPNAPFSYEGRFQAIQSLQATNWHLPEKYENDRSHIPRNKPNLCRGRLVRAFQVRTVTKPGDDNFRYQTLLESYSKTTRAALSMPEDLIDLRIGPSQLQSGSYWIPEIYLRSLVSLPAFGDDKLLCLVTTGTEWRLVVG